MGRAAHLTSGEVAVVRALAADSKSMAEIARRLKRPPNAVRNVLLKGQERGVQEKRGRPSKVSPKLICALRRKGRSGKYSARELRNAFSLDCTVRRVQQLLSSDPRLSWKRMKCKPSLTKNH